MLTVNSISGGGTSGYLGYHFPADFNLFALVCIDEPAAAPKDKKIIQLVNDRLQKYCSHWPEFIATAEDDKTLKVVLDLEQLYGREIIWLRNVSLDQAIKDKQSLMNIARRFCTSRAKMDAIFEFWLYRIGEKVDMRIGYRYDEKERADHITTSYRFPVNCKNFGIRRQEKKSFEWRTCSFPLIENKVLPYKVSEFKRNSGIDFPDDSNCVFCFWKQPEQLKHNCQAHPEKIAWAKRKEAEYKRTFKKGMGFEKIDSTIIIPEGFQLGGGPGCKAGVCMD